MTRPSIAVVFSFAVTWAALSCENVSENDIEIRTSALGGAEANAVTSPVRGFFRTTGLHGAVYQTVVNAVRMGSGTPLSNFGSIPAAAATLENSAPWGYLQHDGKEAVTYVAFDRHVHQVNTGGTGGGSGPADRDLSAAPVNAPPAAAPMPGTVRDVIGFIRPDGKSAVVYRGEDDHVWEVVSEPGTSSWSALDLTSSSAAQVTANKGGPFPYVRSDGYITIVYIGSDNHIHELATLGTPGSGHGVWGDGDLSAATGNLVVPTTDPWGYKRSDNYNSVVFIGADAKMHELALLPGFAWGAHLLPAVQPSGGLNRRPSAFVGPDGFSHVVYVSGITSARELTLIGGSWVESSIPLPPGVTVKGPVFGHLAPGDRESVLFRGLKNGVSHGYELGRLFFGGTWTSWGSQEF